MRATGLEWVMTQRGEQRLLGGGGSQTPISITRCAGHPPSPLASLWGSWTAPHQHGGLHEPPSASPWGAGEPPVMSPSRETPLSITHWATPSPAAAAVVGGWTDPHEHHQGATHTHTFPLPHTMAGWAGTSHQHRSGGGGQTPTPVSLLGWSVIPPSPSWGWINKTPPIIRITGRADGPPNIAVGEPSSHHPGCC